jgi:hypothetical protein
MGRIFGTNDIDADTALGTLPKIMPPPREPARQGFGTNDIDAGSPSASSVSQRPALSFFTGEGAEFPDMPEFRPSEAAGGRGNEQFATMIAGALSAASDDQLANIAKNALPGATLRKDKFGNTIINHNGEDRYINAPGASKRDFIEFLANILAFIPAGKVASLPAKLGARVAVGSVASGATSVGLDRINQALGSEQGVDLPKAGITVIAGGTGEVLAPLAARVLRIFRRSPALFDVATGQLTEKGQKAARAAGLDPNAMGGDLNRIFAEEAAEATGSVGAAQRIRGREFGIPLTRGQATGDFNQLAREEATRHGAFGEKAGGIVRGFDEGQQTALQIARARIQSGIGGGETRIARPAQAGDTVQGGLASRATAQGRIVDDAYEAAAGSTARLSADGIRGLWRRLAASVSERGIDPILHPATTKALHNFRRLESSTRGPSRTGRITAVSLKRLETERRKLGFLIDAASNKADRAALYKVKGEFDSWLDDAVDNALFAGDAGALDLLKAARAERTKFGRLFEARNSRDDVGKVIKRIIGEERSPEEVVNFIFGRGRLGGRDNSARIIGRLKEIFGEGSEEFQALREAGWLKLSKEIGADTFSPAKFRNNLNHALDDARTLIDELYTPEEVAMFGRFRDEVMRTVTPEGVRNPSKTAFTLARLAREWIGRIGTMLTFSGNPLGGAAMFTAKRVPEVLGARAARRATAPLSPARLRAPLFVSGAMAGGRIGAEQ